MAVTPLDPSDPQRLGDYVLTGRLGAGGMGMVYLGEGPDGTTVAVKLVRSDLAHDATFRERFRREVEALRRVAGPRVAQLLAADTEAAQPYLVVEFVDGPTLADSVVRNGPLGGERLRALAAALAEALVLIHEVGVIHRDLKPSNVILAADQPKLVDFGIAAAAGSLPLTVVGTVIGSAGWMAPEQAAGEVSTPAVDVFTWAALVAYAGTGRPPFGVGGPEEVTARILSGEPDLEGLPQEVRPYVEAAFLKDPTRRPTAKALLAGLVGGQEASPTDQLVEETTSLIEHTWVMPVTGWPAAVDATPPMPPAPPAPEPAAAAVPPAPAPAGGGRRVWPVVAAAALVALLRGPAGAVVLSGGDDGGDDTAAGGPGTSAAAPATTVAPTTTTTAPPISVTAQLTLDANDFGDFFEQLLTGDAGCIAPEASVGLQAADGRVLVPPTPFPAGEQVSGGILDACRYTLVFAPVEGLDSFQVTLEDQEGDFEPAPITRAEIDAAGGVVNLNDLFEVEQLVGPV